jgi:hypothetical protein
MATALFPEVLAATHSPRKNPALPHEKLRAFSLPHDSQVELMFGAARFGEPALRASRGLGFHIVPRRPRWPHRLGTLHKCFNQHRIFDATRRLAPPCGLKACSGAVFRSHRRACGRGLPLVCRKAPEVRRKTRHSRAARRTMRLKSFDRQPICRRRNRFFAIQGAEKQDWIASSQELLAMTEASS